MGAIIKLGECKTKMNAVYMDELSEIIHSPGYVRGVVLCTDAKYVLRDGGEETLKRVQIEAEDMGFPIDYGNVKQMNWYPIGLRAISLFAIKNALNWDDEKLMKMGMSAPKHSIITKMMLRFFVSMDILSEKAQHYWNKHYSVGSVMVKVDNSSAFICLRGCNMPRALAPYLEGYFIGATSMVIGNHQHIGLAESIWMHGDGECNEFVLNW
jgi:hypothetical protein